MKTERNFPKAIITKKGENWVGGGHPWIYDAEVLSIEGEYENGSLVDAVSEKGKYIGTGFVSTESKIRIRLVSKNANDKFSVFNSVKYLSSLPKSEYREKIIAGAGIECEGFEDFEVRKKEKSLLFFFLDANKVSEKYSALSELEKALQLAKKSDFKVIVASIMPQIPSFTNGPTSLAERELSFFLEKCCEKTTELSYYLEIESVLRKALENGSLDVSLLRFDNVFSPDFYAAPYVDFEAVIKEFEEYGFVTHSIIMMRNDKINTTSFNHPTRRYWFFYYTSN